MSAHDRESSWVRLVPLAKCRLGAGTFVEHAGRELGVFVLDADQVHVIDNACPHAGGNLSAGAVSQGVVTCPWHHWQFHLATGICVDSTAARARRYPARVEGDWIEIAMED